MLLLGEVGVAQKGEEWEESDQWKTLEKMVNSIGKRGRGRKGSSLREAAGIRRSSTAVDAEYQGGPPQLTRGELLGLLGPECLLDWQALGSNEPRHTQTLLVHRSSVVVRL